MSDTFFVFFFGLKWYASGILKKKRYLQLWNSLFLVNKLGKAKPVKNDASDFYKRTDDKKDL